MRLAGGEEVRADVVVDSSGRNSPTPRWLQDAGWTAPGMKIVDARCVYASAHVAHPEGLPESSASVAAALVMRKGTSDSASATLVTTSCLRVSAE